MCSHWVPQVPKLFPNTFPVAPQLYPIWFAQRPTLMYANWKRWAIGEHIYFNFATWGPKRCFYWGRSAQCLKEVVMGQSICLLSKKRKKKKSVGAPMNWLIWIIPTHKKKREAPSLHDLTSHWLHGNFIPKIGCHYFWPRLSNSPS